MGKYAKSTVVNTDRTMEEIRKTVKRYGAAKFATIESETHVGIAFEMCKRNVRFVMLLPQRKDFVAGASNQHGAVKGQISDTAYEQGVRQRWRALLLVIKAKLESVESGIESFDESFMAQIVLPSGNTMAEWAKPQIEAAYSTGKMPPLLGSGS